MTNHAYLAELFAEEGYEFCGIDQKGFGLSDGVKGRIENKEVMVNDIQKFSHLYLEKFADSTVPRFLIGNSMGGLAASFIAADPK